MQKKSFKLLGFAWSHQISFPLTIYNFLEAEWVLRGLPYVVLRALLLNSLARDKCGMAPR